MTDEARVWSGRAAPITAAESSRLRDRTPGSAALYERAVRSMPLGVPSSFQAWSPNPVYLRDGKGSTVWDVDGNEYRDFHNGFGCMVVGHAHPKVAEAVASAARTGTHFAAPTEATVAFAEEICRRFQVEEVRFANSGTEATMGAIRVARAATGREHIAKIEGSYHGHHDAVMFSVVPNSDVVGGRDAPATTPMSTGIPKVTAEYTHVVPFNDLAALEALLDDRGGDIACLILEPVMMNIGICRPEPSYLQSVKELLHKHGALLVFDEVKSGATIAAGGATELYGVLPDLACWAKAICGGTPGAAFGGRADVMEAIETGAAQQGTFNGNPLVAAAGLAALTEVLTPGAYEYLAALGTRLAAGCQAAIDEHGIPAHAVDLGAKGCVSYRREPLSNYRDFLDTNPDLYLASYPWAMNRGVFMTPGDEEQWTLSVQHTEADVDRYIEAFAEFCSALSAA
ncbi:MAG TPA: aspartate aminotransferase family protein [Acidimicrobiia bacterium]|jgi:glutamate-1-semialdehyde 2,1-aminomutase